MIMARTERKINSGSIDVTINGRLADHTVRHWSGSPRTKYLLSCGHVLIFRGNGPKKNDHVWCRYCDKPQIVIKSLGPA